MPPAVETQPAVDGEQKKPSNIIYPPPEVRNIVDKTAGFVAKNGPDFENTIRQKEANNPKFNFLNANDPYHAYYQMKVRDIAENKVIEPSKPVAAPGAPQLATQARQAEIVSKLVTEAPQVPKEPPPEYEFVADPPSISALELDIVKLTAQFVARNGRQFLTNLMNREQKNYHFDFLKPQHALFNYFTKLLEQYTKIMIPPKDLLRKLDEESADYSVVLKQVTHRVDWIKHEESMKKKLEDEEERERVAYAQIDWHDFVVVETVDYQPGEAGNFPAPTTPDEVGARVLLQARIDQGEEVEMQLESDEESEEEQPPGETQGEDMEESSESESEEEAEEPIAPPPPPKLAPKAPAPLPPVPEQVIVKKGYDPKQKIITPKVAPAPDEYLISPITGEKIPASQVQQHMKVGLLDPRWVEQRDRQIAEKMNQESVYAPGTAIESSLKQLAERRTDIFGVGVEETAIGKKVGEEETKKDDKVTWDGHTGSAEAVARAARMTVSLGDQIAQIHKVKGLVADESKEKIGPKISETPPAPKPVPVPVPKPPVQQQINIPMVVPVLQQPVVVMNVVRPVGSVGLVGIAQPTMQTPLQSFMAAAAQQQQQMQQAAAAAAQRHDQEDEPPSKKQKTEDNLIPEHIFLQRSRGTVSIIVVVPTSNEKNEWKLNGQTLQMALPLTDSASVIKAKVHEVTNMPPGKQKLVWDGLFFKDQNSLAYYNVTDGAVIQVQVKERGGRKK